LALIQSITVSHSLVTTSLSSAETLSLTFSSCKEFLTWKQYPSKLFLASTFFLIASSSALYFSASLTSLSISSLESLPLLFVI